MYLDNWDFTQNPFDNSVASGRIFQTNTLKKIISHIQHAIEQQHPLAIITGETGVGKSTFIKLITHNVANPGYKIITIHNSFDLENDFDSALISKLMTVNFEDNKLDYDNQLLYLINSYKKHYKKLIIIIDDAHLIKSISIFEKLENFVRRSERFIFLIVVGQFPLKNKIKNLPSINQLISIDEEIPCFSAPETIEYIKFRMRTSGVDFDIFTSAVEQKIYEHSNGLPRTINCISEKCLLKANQENQKIIDLDVFNGLTDLKISHTVTIEDEKNQLYESLYKLIKSKYNNARKNEKISLIDIWDSSQSLVRSLNTDKSILKIALMEDNEFQLETHSINVAILAGYLASSIFTNESDIRLLVTAALIHDIGMTQIPKEILDQSKILTNHELKQIKLHPILGNKIIKCALNSLTNDDKHLIPEIILQEHERDGGIGYPYNISSAHINEFAKILGLCDTFESLIHSRPWRKRIHPSIAIKKLIQLDNKYFNMQFKKILITRLSLYPIGSTVHLNSGEIAQVVDINELQPLRPFIKINKVTNRSGEIRNLIDFPMLYITKVLT